MGGFFRGQGGPGGSWDGAEAAGVLRVRSGGVLSGAGLPAAGAGADWAPGAVGGERGVAPPQDWQEEPLFGLGRGAGLGGAVLLRGVRREGLHAAHGGTD